MTNERWTLGEDLAVNRLGYGTMKLTGWPRGEAPARDTAMAILRRAVDLGVNHLDTSNYYARDGVSANELIRTALHPYPDDLVIVTKVGALVEGPDITLPPTEQRGLTPDGLRRGIEANLRSLGVDRLDVVNLRMGDRGHTDAPLEGALETLMSLRAEGLVRHIGVSNVSPEQVDRARAVAEIVCVQNLYNIAARDDDPLVDTCAEAGIAYVPFFPVGGFQPLTAEHLSAVASRHDITVPQVALAWLLARSPNIVLIPGTSSLAHLEQNIAAAQVRLTEDDLALLDAAR
ncbi:oxidoreductase [Micromonospora parathelypteridis]|uniref:Aryl-alcohol dehydrogenase-like predicted oxidoreductase n=1 Tax=Micromonospora parathelypteridis TaxID=1839617 RepID=A0A840VYU3_9ACTN|nr:oxidoreductase [Micromonospora parathelypteridis]MBB5476151.1 aryl-alcohol dehydrogenase-like predicted oxidoreductase [Micromonospora parathelypteridis]GGO13629.1 oxidoreductase [Micromonospora parathelypteridis]